MKSFGYMGLTKPLETIWADGRKVLLDPSGLVVDLSTGDKIRRKDKLIITKYKSNNSNLMIVLGVVALVSLVILSKR